MKALYIVSAIYLILLGTVVSQPAPDVEVQAISPYTICERDTYASNLHCATNAHRESVGLPALAYSPQAESVAKKRAAHLCETDTFTHDGWKDAIDFNYTKAGENLAKNFDTPQGAVKGLLSSKSHRAAIEGSYSSLGVATEYCGGRNITVQIFTQG